jgi:hypothetical protein
MHRQRHWTPLLVIFLLLLSSLACSVSRFLPNSGAQLPERTVSVNPEAAAAAATVISQAGRGGTIRLTESQFTSFLMERLNQQDGGDTQVEALTVWFDPGVVYLQVRTREALVPGGNTIALVGHLSAVDGRLSLNVDQASVGRVSVPASVLSLVNDQMHTALVQSQIGDIPVKSITVEQGAIVIEPTS